MSFVDETENSAPTHADRNRDPVARLPAGISATRVPRRKGGKKSAHCFPHFRWRNSLGSRVGARVRVEYNGCG